MLCLNARSFRPLADGYRVCDFITFLVRRGSGAPICCCFAGSWGPMLGLGMDAGDGCFF